MMSKTPRILSKALLGLTLVSVALVGCTPTEGQTDPKEVAPTASAEVKPAPGEVKAEDAQLTESELAAEAVSVYAKALHSKDATKTCDAISPEYVKLTVDSADNGDTCIQVFDKIFLTDANQNAPENIDVKKLSVAGKKVSDTMYTFPLSAVTEGSQKSITVTRAGDDWKVGLPQEQQEAAKQLAENNPTDSPTTETAK